MKNTNNPPVPDAAQARLRKLAFLLDSAIPLPGGKSIGIESVVGLIPGVGDLLGALASGYIILEGIKMGAPKSVVLKMVLNVLLESTIGVIPVVGDLFDFFYKSNQLNVAMLIDSEQTVDTVKRKSRWKHFLLFPCIMIVVILSLWLMHWLIKFSVNALLEIAPY